MGKHIDALLHFIGIAESDGRKVVSEEIFPSESQPDSEDEFGQDRLDLERISLDGIRLHQEEELSSGEGPCRIQTFDYAPNEDFRGLFSGVSVRNGLPSEKGVAIVVGNETELSDLVERLKKAPEIAHRLATDQKYQGNVVALYVIMGDDPYLFDTPDKMTVYCFGGLHTFSKAGAEGFVAHNGRIYSKYSGKYVAEIKLLIPDGRLEAFGIRVLTDREYGAMRYAWRHLEDPKVKSDLNLPADYRQQAINQILEPEKATEKQTTEQKSNHPASLLL